MCLASCPEEAITIHEKARIDPEKCVLMLQLHQPLRLDGKPGNRIPHPATKNWSTPGLAESAYACLKGFRAGKVLYINVLKNLTAGCDCMPWAGSPKWPNQGITASYDLLATDQASLDLTNQPSAASEDLDILIPVKSSPDLLLAELKGSRASEDRAGL